MTIQKTHHKIIIISVLLIILFGFAPSNFVSNGLLKIGSKAPNFELKTVQKKKIKLSDYNGKVVILDFWYVGCAPCVKAYNDLKSLEDKFGRDKFEIIGMNPINRKWQIRRFVRKGNYNSLATYCSHEVKDNYKVKYYPTIYIIDKKGNIAFAKGGYYPKFKEDLETCLTKALGGDKKEVRIYR